MPQMVLVGRNVRFCQHCGRFQTLQEFDGAFKSCRKSLQRHRNSQSRRIRTKSSTKASSGSDEFSGGGSKNRRTSKRSPATGGPNSSINDTEDSNNNEDSQSPYDGSTPGGSAINTRSADGGSGIERERQQQCGGSNSNGNGLVPMFGFPPGVAENLSSALNGNALNGHAITSARRMEDAPVMNTTTNLPIPCTNVVAPLPYQPAVAQMDLMPIDDLYAQDDANPADWIPNLMDTTDDLILADPQRHHPRLAPLPSTAAASAAVARAGYARAMPSLLENNDHQHQHQPTSSSDPPAVDVSNCSLDAAFNLVTYEYPDTLASPYDGSTVIRASLKLFNTHPEHLPHTVRDALMEVVSSSETFLTANARPGCVHITANVVLSKSEAQAVETGGAKGLLTKALAQGTALIPAECMEGPRSAFLTQINSQIAALGVSGTIASVSLDSTSDTSSEIHAVVPLAMTPTHPHHVTLLGKSISGDLDMVVCRRGEDTPDLGVMSSGPSQILTAPDTADVTSNSADGIVPDENGASGSGSRSPVNPRRLSTDSSSSATATVLPTSLPTMRYPPSSFTSRGLAAGEYVQFSLIDVKEGLHNIEIQKGCMLSPSAQSLLVIDNADVVAELRQLEIDATGVNDIPSFIQAVGIVVEHLKLRREGGGHPNGSLAVAQRIAPLAASIVTVAVARKWPALLRVICPAASPSDVQASISALSRRSNTTDEGNNGTSESTAAATDGLALLHMVAASGSVDLVDALEEWGRSAGHTWLCQAAGSAWITPLHIAAILDDNAAMATALTNLFGISCHRSWYYAKGADGVTPAQAAKIAGNDAVLEFLNRNLPPKESISSFSYEIDSSGYSSLCTTGGSVGGGGAATTSDGASLQYSSGLLGGIHSRKYSSTSYDDAPPCPDEWPYSTLYGTNGLLQRSVLGSTTRDARTRTGTAETAGISGSEVIKRAGLSVRDAGATVLGVALSFVAGVGAMAVRLWS
jgi:hypothetical protein